MEDSSACGWQKGVGNKKRESLNSAQVKAVKELYNAILVYDVQCKTFGLLTLHFYDRSFSETPSYRSQAIIFVCGRMRNF